MRRQSPFDFICQQCSRCCQHQAIQINPYEILCLARHLGLSTGQFMARHTTNGGLFLRFNDQGACVFLGEQGCGVHPERPLACRLYPLGREVDPPDGESFDLLERHPDCAARVGGQGLLGQYLEQQGAGRFLAAADLYLAVVLEAQARIERRLPPGASLAAATSQGLDSFGGPLARELDPWLDVDGLLGLATPEPDPWRAMQAHLAAIRAWLAGLDQA
ncbi:MAG: YkgJ family cysteine cluster protein [Pseudomonadota bacterium]